MREIEFLSGAVSAEYHISLAFIDCETYFSVSVNTEAIISAELRLCDS
jgi:hypothetical protein